MFLSNTLAILGVVSTVLLGIMGIFYTFKLRNNHKLLLIGRDLQCTFRSFGLNVDDISISFKGQPLGQKVAFFRATIINDGNTDIDKSIIYKPLQIKAPNSCKWLHAVISQNSAGLSAEVNIIAPDTLEFTWDILKKGELLTFDSLVEVSLPKPKKHIEKCNLPICLHQFDNGLKISHRISNIGSVERSYSKDFSKSYKLKKLLIPLFVNFVMGTTLIILNILNPSNEIRYSIKTGNQEKIVRLIAINHNSVKIKAIDKSIKETLPLDEIKKKYQLPVTIGEQRILRYTITIFGSCVVLLSVLAMIYYFALRRREGKMRKLLGIDGEK